MIVGFSGLQFLRETLVAAAYDPESLKRLLGITYSDDVGLLNHAPALERVAGDRSAAATLTRLLFLEADEPRRNVAAVWSRRDCATLIRLGVLRQHAGRLRARLRIDPIGEQYFMADTRFRRNDRRAAHLPDGDAVYPPSSDSVMLRDAVGTQAAARILDLCTGSGVQALQQAPHADRVVAVDINARAVAMARLNAQLNGVGNVDVRCGDLYAPVRGEQFGLIIANPPFVSSPYVTAPSYHSGGPSGDRVLRRVIAGLGSHLADGGRAFAISHVAIRVGANLEAVAARWFREFPGRALVLVLETGTPVDLAAAQSLFALARGLSAYAKEVRRWIEYLRRHRIGSIALILVVAQRGDRRGVEVVDAQPRVLPLPLSPPLAKRIDEWFGANRR